MKNTVLFLFLLVPVFVFSQYILKNEEVIFSFETKQGKKMFLVKDMDNQYIQYRFGSKNNIEMQYPKERNLSSWKKFGYNSYWRGGGIQNAGMEIDNISFDNDGYHYLVYRTYFSEGEDYYAGIKITNSKGAVTRIRAKYKTVTGCICNLEETGKIEKKDIGLDY